MTNLLLFVLAFCAAVYGVTYAYFLHQLANVVAAWLVLVHFSDAGLSFAGVRQMLEGEGTVNIPGESNAGDVKKRP